MKSSTVKVARKFGLFGLAFNVLIVLLSWSYILAENSLKFISLSMIVLGVLATSKTIYQDIESGSSVNFWNGARIGWISGSIAVLPVMLISLGIGLGLIYYGNLGINEGDEWLWFIGAVIIARSVQYALTILFCVLSAGFTAIILKNSKRAVSSIKDFNRS